MVPMIFKHFDKQYVYFKDQYKQWSGDQFKAMFKKRHKQIFGGRQEIKGAKNVAQHMYKKNILPSSQPN